MQELLQFLANAKTALVLNQKVFVVGILTAWIAQLKDSRACLIKCGTVFLPCGVGVGAGDQDLQEALETIQARKTKTGYRDH